MSNKLQQDSIELRKFLDSIRDETNKIEPTNEFEEDTDEWMIDSLLGGDPNGWEDMPGNK